MVRISTHLTKWRFCSPGRLVIVETIRMLLQDHDLIRDADGNPRKLIFLLASPEIWALWGKRVQAALAPREPIVLFLRTVSRAQRRKLGGRLLIFGGSRP